MTEFMRILCVIDLSIFKPMACVKNIVQEIVFMLGGKMRHTLIRDNQLHALMGIKYNLDVSAAGNQSEIVQLINLDSN